MYIIGVSSRTTNFSWNYEKYDAEVSTVFMVKVSYEMGITMERNISSTYTDKSIFVLFMIPIVLIFL